MVKNYTFLDLETHNASTEYGMTPREFIRMGQYAINDGPVTLTTDYDEILEVARSADYLITHNGISSDMLWLFGQDSTEALHMAMDRRVIDTWYVANLLFPAPQRFKMRSGRVAVETTKPVEHARSWLSLDNLCFQFDLPGKIGNLTELAKKHNPPGTKRDDLEYGLIPVDDPDFLAYAEQDVVALRELFRYLMNQIKEQDYDREYIWREMALMAATCGQMQLNGILVNQEYAIPRIEAQEKEKAETLKFLVDTYDFPTEGKSPWSSNLGKEATLKALADFGFTPENTPEWELTPKGAPKLGGEDLLKFAKDTEAEDFVTSLGRLKGMRSISQLVMDNIKEDGRVHPDVTSLQRSGRWSFTSPAVTVFGERNERLRKDKALFIAAPGKVLAGFDYSSADARAMAGLSGDHAYAQRFAEDENGEDLYDGHNLMGEAVFGADFYYGDGPRDKSARPVLRSATKPVTHGSNYGIGAYKLAKQINEACRKEGLDLFFWASAGKDENGKPRARPIPIPEKYERYFRNDEYIGGPLPEGMFLAKNLLRGLEESYPFLTRFKREAYEFAKEHGFIINPWGRRMPVVKERAWNQAPAQFGQGVTREMMGDAILRLCERGEYYIRSMRAIIHDELLLEFNEDTIEKDIAVVKECMEVDFVPHTKQGFPIRFPVGHGYGKTWLEAGH